MSLRSSSPPWTIFVGFIENPCSCSACYFVIGAAEPNLPFLSAPLLQVDENRSESGIAPSSSTATGSQRECNGTEQAPPSVSVSEGTGPPEVLDEVGAMEEEASRLEEQMYDCAKLFWCCRVLAGCAFCQTRSIHKIAALAVCVRRAFDALKAVSDRSR